MHVRPSDDYRSSQEGEDVGEILPPLPTFLGPEHDNVLPCPVGGYRWLTIAPNAVLRPWIVT